MRKESITKILLEKKHKIIYENSSKVLLESVKSFDRYESYFYDELPNIEVNGFPIGADLIDKHNNVYTMNEYAKLDDATKKECRLRYHYLPLSHEFYIGTTGSGKTTGCVEPQVRAICNQKNKPNLLITDPKGEIFNHNAKFLKERGYQIFLLNFKDTSKTDTWNPLLDVYESAMRLKKYKAEPKIIEGKPKKNVNCYSTKFDSEYYLEFDGYAFGSVEDVNKYKQSQMDLIQSETDSLVKQFCYVFCPISEKTRDVEWQQGAQRACEGLVLAMIDDALNEENTGFTKDMFTIKTLFDYYNRLRVDLVTNDDNPDYTLLNHPLMAGKTRAIEKTSTMFANAPRTARGYCGVFESVTKDWLNGHIFAITTSNTIEINDLSKPFACFIVTRDYEKSDFQIAGLFIDFLYRKLVQSAEELINHNNEKPRPTHFILDEFGNIPRIESFENKIATSRSRNIWMHLFVQSYEQLGFVYSEQQAKIILSNCNSHIYLGSQDYESIEKFSRECGKASTRVFDTNFELSNTYYEFPVLKMSDLDLIEPGSMYIKRLYSPVIYSHYIRSYFLRENNILDDFTLTGLNEYAPNNIEGFNSEKYTYKLCIRADDDDDDIDIDNIDFDAF